MVGAKYPLLKAALISEQFEKQAKAHVFKWKAESESLVETTKNAFSIFGYQYVHYDESRQNQQHLSELLFAFNWDKELPYVLELKEQIIKLLELERGLPQGFPSDVYNLMEKANFQPDKSGNYLMQYLPVIWQTAYNFKRATLSIPPDIVHRQIPVRL